MRFLFCSLFLFAANLLIGQTADVRGSVNPPSAGVRVFLEGTEYSTYTNAEGFFLIPAVPVGEYELVAETPDVGVRTKSTINVTQSLVPIDLRIELGSSVAPEVQAEDVIPTITVTEMDNDNTGGAQNISGMLTASRDVYANAAAFNFSTARFRIRGLRAENTQFLINGAPMNDLESGAVFWSAWGGLNDMTRLQQINIGIQPMSFAFGGLGGGTSIDAKAGSQRRQLRISYASSNRGYRHRLMGTWSSGLLPGGWAIALSGSHRWAEEGYEPGSSFRGWSYFASIEKKLGRNQSLTLTAFSAPIIRGRGGAASEEARELSGQNYYNPNWGWQNGQKRNVSVQNVHQPVIILTHVWQPKPTFTMTSSFSAIFGRNGTSAFNWQDGADPRPDFYRNMPSAIALTDPFQALQVADAWRNDTDENLRQINWDNLYNVNRNSFETVTNANGIEGNTVSGNRARYIVEERRFDSQKFNFNTYFESSLADNISLNGGASYQWYRGNNFTVVKDLLGADYWFDVDRFTVQDTAANGNTDFYQNDLDNPNKVVRVGDRFNYDYDANIRRANAWGQLGFALTHWDFFVGAEFSYTSFWRDGNLRNGRFPDNSFGESEKQNFLNYLLKGGVTYKINGRNYLFVSGMYGTRAPFFRNAYVSPRFRDQVIPNLTDELVYSLEGGYQLRTPFIRAKLVGYFARIDNQALVRSFFVDVIQDDGDQNENDNSGFVNYIMNNIDHQHLGVEFAAEIKIANGLSLRTAATVSQQIYASRPVALLQVDENQTISETRTVYIRNYRLANGPQNAYTLGLSYNAKEFWFANVNVNYFHNNWIEPFPDRRTLEALSTTGLTPEFQEQIIDNPAQIQQIIGQTELPGGFTVDFFGGKSWKIETGERDFFLNLNIGVSNLLNNQSLRTGGFEQFRFDGESKELYPNRTFSAFGATYFVSLTARI
jgi:hypothetical protein